MTVLGIDPGTADCAIAAVTSRARGYVLEETRHICQPPDGILSRRQLCDVRCERIEDELKAMLNEHRPDAVCIEDQHQTIASMIGRRKTKIDNLLVLEVVGAVTAIVRGYGLPLCWLSPQQVKTAVGLPANASKDQVRRMVCRMVKVPGVGHPGPNDLSEHEADAVALAIGARAGWQKLKGVA